MKVLIVLLTLLVITFQGGCGIISVLATPTSYEKKIAAEYELVVQEEKKLLILVDQPGWINVGVNMRYYLTNEFQKNLVHRVELLPETLIDYSKLSEFRSNQSNFSFLTPVEVAKALEADWVLFIKIVSLDIQKISDADYFSGQMIVRTALFETATAAQVWPDSDGGKKIKVGFDSERRGREFAIRRLARACAYCTTRYLYNCPKEEFKRFDDKSSIKFQRWEQ